MLPMPAGKVPVIRLQEVFKSAKKVAFAKVEGIFPVSELFWTWNSWSGLLVGNESAIDPENRFKPARNMSELAQS